MTPEGWAVQDTNRYWTGGGKHPLMVGVGTSAHQSIASITSFSTSVFHPADTEFSQSHTLIRRLMDDTDLVLDQKVPPIAAHKLRCGQLDKANPPGFPFREDLRVHDGASQELPRGLNRDFWFPWDPVRSS